MILPIIRKRGFKNIWCPFDTEESEFVKILSKEFNVVYGHISKGQDFFSYDVPPDSAEVVISNPPFSKRNEIFQKLYDWNIPFGLIMNIGGLFDSKARYDLFANNEFELLIPKGRIKFFTADGVMRKSPNFQSVYVCSKLLDNQIEFLNNKN